MRWWVSFGVLWPSIGWAFCGAYVGSPGQVPTNRSSQVAFTTDGERSVLTFAVDQEGDVADFGLLVPVPPGLDDADVRLVDAGLFATLDAYSGGRLVRYTCDDAVVRSHYSNGIGCAMEYATADSSQSLDSGGAWGGGPEADGAVTVEAAFSEGVYDFVVLDATDGVALRTWLAEQGFELPRDERGILDEYIEGGQQFLAARVRLDAAVDGEWLQPIQLRYPGSSTVIPIRIGTLSASGPQDVVVYTLTSDAYWGITTYPEVELETDCMLPKGIDLPDHLEQATDAAFGGEPAAWMVEYAWGGGKCDPCTVPDGLGRDVMREMGFEQEDAWSPFYFTRLHVRYAPEAAEVDLVLQSTGDTQILKQLRFIEHNKNLDWLYPVCGEGMVDDPGSCPTRGRSSRAWMPLGLLGAGLLLVAVARRRA
ncbi:MAG: hypothetical protein ACI9K2_003266 [Myxococcota bacterium]|jgi:hypothetical protein